MSSDSPDVASGASDETSPAELPHTEALAEDLEHHDLGQVQAHNSAHASQANEAMGAEAYASDDAIAFRDGPGLDATAHEAAHVVQQQDGTSGPATAVRPDYSLTDPDPRVEDAQGPAAGAASPADASAGAPASASRGAGDGAWSDKAPASPVEPCPA
jgi:hypothetical protein